MKKIKSKKVRKGRSERRETETAFSDGKSLKTILREGFSNNEIRD